MENATNLEFYIQHGKEERYLEYKRSMVWIGNLTTKIKIAKAMMAMSNLIDGGVIVVGMKESPRGVWEPEVMTDEQIASFNQDNIAQWVNDHAVPAVQFTVEPFTLDTNKFVIIKVSEFDSYPTVCRKQAKQGGEALVEGAIYYRSNSKNESAPISHEEDMRQLITRATNKRVNCKIKRFRELGFVAPLPSPREDDALKYAQEREGR